MSDSWQYTVEYVFGVSYCCLHIHSHCRMQRTPITNLKACMDMLQPAIIHQLYTKHACILIQ